MWGKDVFRPLPEANLLVGGRLSHKSDAPQKICSVTRDNA